ncbi:MAG TPA: outer membrane lipoprotein-sorting protein [Thermoanaerobaculia bacterium]|nr:outer membrane lipoprotein-sorting protein [Thermoanaerobaculia bacterium]
MLLPRGVLGSCLAIAATVLAGRQPAQAQTSDPRALRLVDAYNQRNFGDPGWRSVQLDLKSGETITRSFVVDNLWRLQGETVRMLFVLQEPGGLRGTNYLLIEDPAQVAEMQVFLHLPAGERKVLTIAPSHFDEGLLGSDFGYRDMRMRLPTRGFRFRYLGARVLGKQAVLAVEASPSTEEGRLASPWVRSILYFHSTEPVLLGADYYARPDSPEPDKRQRVLDYRRIDGAWTETRIEMTAGEGHSSLLSLREFRSPAPSFDASLLEPQALGSALDRLGAIATQGSPPAGAKRGGGG